MDTVSKINRLRDHMKEVGVDVALIPTSDCHNSEYAAHCFKLREYLSGFTGSAGTLIEEWMKLSFIQTEDILSRPPENLRAAG